MDIQMNKMNKIVADYERFRPYECYMICSFLREGLDPLKCTIMKNPEPKAYITCPL